MKGIAKKLQDLLIPTPISGRNRSTEDVHALRLLVVKISAMKPRSPFASTKRPVGNNPHRQFGGSIYQTNSLMTFTWEPITCKLVHKILANSVSRLVARVLLIPLLRLCYRPLRRMDSSPDSAAQCLLESKLHDDHQGRPLLLVEGWIGSFSGISGRSTMTVDHLFTFGANAK